jgi:hypothetical protein
MNVRYQKKDKSQVSNEVKFGAKTISKKILEILDFIYFVEVKLL